MVIDVIGHMLSEKASKTWLHTFMSKFVSKGKKQLLLLSNYSQTRFRVLLYVQVRFENKFNVILNPFPPISPVCSQHDWIILGQLLLLINALFEINRFVI